MKKSCHFGDGVTHSVDLAGIQAGSAAVQGAAWGVRAGSWARVQEGLRRPLFDAGLRHIGIRPGMKHLDVGCGAGEALWISRQMGATVFGFDATEALIRIAQKRIPDGEFRVGDMEALPYEDGMFDGVTGFNSFHFASEVHRAVAEAKRVTRRGGLCWLRSVDHRVHPFSFDFANDLRVTFVTSSMRGLSLH